MQKLSSGRMSVKYFVASIVMLAILVLLLTPLSVFAITEQSDWTTISTSHFKIYATRRADLEQIGQVAESIYSELATHYKYKQSEPIKLYVYTDHAAFLSESPSADAAGYASPSQNLIAVLLGAGNSTITLGHEISHIMFMRSVPTINTVPIWFIEGLAIYDSQPGVEATEIEKYALTRDVPDLVGRANQSPDAHASPQDYAQGYMVINFIVNKFGEKKLYEAVGKMQSGASFNDALTQVLGLSQDKINTKWKEYARGEETSIWLMQLRDVSWYILGGLVILVIIIAPLRKRKRMREMEDEDELSGEPEISDLETGKPDTSLID